MQGFRQFPFAIDDKHYFKIISVPDCIFQSKMTQEWMDGLSIVRQHGQHLLTAGRKEIQEEQEVDRIRYHNPETQLIYWMVLQNREKLVFSFKMTLPKLQKYKDLLEYPTKIKDACRGLGRRPLLQVSVELRGEEGFTSTPGPARLAAFWGDN